MTDPIRPERLAEIRNAHQQDQERGTVVPSQVPDIVAHRAELLAEVDRLSGEGPTPQAPQDAP